MALNLTIWWIGGCGCIATDSSRVPKKQKKKRKKKRRLFGLLNIHSLLQQHSKANVFPYNQIGKAHKLGVVGTLFIYKLFIKGRHERGSTLYVKLRLAYII